jgi:hypothetical protein
MAHGPHKGVGTPGSAWGRLTPPPLGMPLHRRAIPPAEPSPGRPREQSSGMGREGQEPEG